MSSLSLQIAKAKSRLARLNFPFRGAPTPNGIEPQQLSQKVGANFDTDWSRSLPARLVRLTLVELFMKPLMIGIASPSVQGTDRLQQIKGPMIFAANHHSHADTPLLLTTIPEPWRHRLVVGAAADYFFHTRLGGFVAALTMGAIPIERTRAGRQSASLASDLVADGWNLLIFPEGGRSPDGWGQPFRGGAAYLAIRTGAPVVPVHLQGTGRILRKGKKIPQPSKTTVTFGEPLLPNEKETYRAFAARLESSVAALADEATSDWWQARLRIHANTSPSLTGPDVGTWRRVWALGDRTHTRRREKQRWPDL